ncbi:MAG: UbiD family decarboxylase [Desulfurococcales archaeon]|nr:UbiD family decarboxylase [Desulfurococcales archaeon]
MADPLKDLRTYLEWLQEKDSLVTITDPLSPILEIPAFLRKVMYSKGPAVLFENVKGYPGWRIAGNLYPNLNLFKQALGVDKLEEIGLRLVGMALRSPPTSLRGKIKGLLEAGSLAKTLPSKSRRATFTDNIIEAERNPLEKIPAFKTWPLDGGRYLTFPLVVTKDPVDDVYNIGVYRVMILDGRRAVIHWQIHKRGAKAYFDAEEKLPVAIVVGSDPATMFTGVAPAPHPLDKYLFAGLVRGRGIELYELPSGLLVPANAEIVIEGYVKKGELAEEGPFGDHWGYYDRPIEKYPVFHVEHVYHRDNPIYYGSVVGMPPLEDAIIGKAIERIFLPIMKTLLPEIVDVNFPEYGVFQGMMIVSIRKRYPGHAKKVMNALWGVGQTSLTKIIIVVDEDIDVHNIDQVIWAVSSHVNPSRDVLVIHDTQTDALDPAMTAPGYGSKLGIDATRKLPEENNGRPWPLQVEEDPGIADKIDVLYRKYFPTSG